MKTESNEPISAGRFQFTTHYEGGSGTGSRDFIGLTKREHFAAVALQGLVAGASSSLEIMKELGGKDEIILSKSAVQYADALIAELNK